PDLGSVAIAFDPALLPKEKLLTLVDRVIANLGQGRHKAAADTVDPDAPVNEYTMAIDGMTCASCALLVEMLLRRDPRVEHADVNYATETATVRARLNKDTLVHLVD